MKTKNTNLCQIYLIQLQLTKKKPNEKINNVKYEIV